MKNAGIPSLETQYQTTTTHAHRKQFAQFFTPPSIADFMAHWVINNRTDFNLLDPALGLGIFPRAVWQTAPNVHVTGYDLDPHILSQANTDFQDKLYTLHCTDFLHHDWHTEYDAILANPPYFRFQDFVGREKALNTFEAETGVQLSGFSNIYVLFLLKALRQLAKGGRAAFIVPAEFLNADYGVTVKQELIRMGMLRHVLVMDFEVFEDALTTACVLLFANDGKTDLVSFHMVREMDEMPAFPTTDTISPTLKNTALSRHIRNDKLVATKKWRNYYEGEQAGQYHNLVPFNQYGRVVRGIATGANDFFVFNRSKQVKWNMPDQFLLPCLTRAKQCEAPVFTQADFEALDKNDQKVWLFDGGDGQNEAVKKYLAHGETLGVHTKYLTRHRSPWWAVEQRPPSPIWVNVFNRAGLRFVQNEAGVWNLTTFHCVYLHEGVNAELLFSYLQTKVAKEILNDNRREYGGGLRKFEPNDVNGGLVLDLGVIAERGVSQILDLWEECRHSSRQIATLNQLFLSYLLKP